MPRPLCASMKKGKGKMGEERPEKKRTPNWGKRSTVKDTASSAHADSFRILERRESGRGSCGVDGRGGNQKLGAEAGEKKQSKCYP